MTQLPDSLLSEAPGKQRAKPAGKCIFCDRTGVTKEHLFPDWLRELFPRKAEKTHTYGITENGPEFKLRTKQGHSGTKKVRKICGCCNNRWISRIDESAKKVAVPLIRGTPTKISPTMQQALASWLAKIAMVGDVIEADKAYISQNDRNYLMNQSKAPELWEVWIGSYAGTVWRELAIYQHRNRLEWPGPFEHSGSYISASIIGMGCLLALVVGHDAPTHTIDMVNLPFC